MNSRLTPPDWDAFDSNMLINVGDMKYYYENFTEVVDEQATGNKLAIGTIDGRVTALEQSIPVGPGGDGAYLHLGGTPGRYPTAEEMVAGNTNEETSFMVIARPDGIYFYNPKSKVVIPPKKGGGTIAVHGQFPQIFDAGHNLTHNGRMGMSGVYTANVADVGLETHFPSNPTCKVLIVVNEDGEEHQTAFSPDGMASRTFRAGTQITPWVVSSGGGSSGGDVTKADLISGHQLVNANSIGSDPVTTANDITAVNMATSPVVVGTGMVAGRKFTMADIAESTVTNLNANQVREGRVTYVVNMSTVTRSVELVNRCKFNMDGTSTTLKQTIPAKTAWVFSPGIYATGDKVWTFMGALSAESIDIKDLIARLEALEAGGGPGAGGVTNFVGLTDTPDAYTGQGNRFLAVKADESGVEFVTTPSIDTKPLEDRIDAIDQNIINHVADFELMRDGHIPTSWNGLGARPITSPNDITVANITESPFVIGTGTVAGKKFILPDIAELEVMSLGAGQVREGRATYLVNLGNVDRTIEVTAGCKINVSGGAVTTPVVIPRKTSWMMSPGVYAGDKVWTFIGSLSAESLDIANLIDRLDAVESRRVIENFTDLADTPADYRPGQVLRYNQAGTAVTSSEFALKHLTDTPSDYTGQKGKMLVVNNGETAMEFATVPDHSSMESDINNNHNSIITIQNEQTIQNQQIEIAKKPVSSIVEHKTYTTSNNVQSSVIGDQDVVIQELLTSSNPIIWLPTIVDRTTTLASSQCWVGKRYSFLNRGEVDTVIKTPGTGGTIALPDRTTVTNLTLKKGHSADFVTAGTGSAGIWVLVRIGPIDDTVVATGGGNVNDYVTGNALLHQNSLGGPTVLSGEQVISGSLVASSAMVLVSAWQDSGFVNMPKITAHTTNPLPADHVRAGRVTSIYNRSSNSKSITIRPDPAWTATIKMKNKSYTNINNFVLGPGKVAKFTPLIDAGVQYWALIEEYTF